MDGELLYLQSSWFPPWRPECFRIPYKLIHNPVLFPYFRESGLYPAGKRLTVFSMRPLKIDKSELMFDSRFLKSLIIPLLVETLLSVTIGLMDTIMVAGVGEHAVSGVSLIDSISALFIFLFSAFATGGAVVASQYLGKKEPENARYSAKQLMYLSIGFSVAVSALLFVFRTQVLHLIYGTIDADVMDSAVMYFEPILISFPFLAVLNSANALFRSMGKSRITMIVSIIMNVINVTGNYILINIVGLETLGAGIASLASRAVACFYMVYKVTRPQEVIHIEDPLRFDFSLPMIRRVLRVALPSGIENSMFHIGKILLRQTAANQFGRVALQDTDDLVDFPDIRFCHGTDNESFSGTVLQNALCRQLDQSLPHRRTADRKFFADNILVDALSGLKGTVANLLCDIVIDMIFERFKSFHKDTSLICCVLYILKRNRRTIYNKQQLPEISY